MSDVVNTPISQDLLTGLNFQLSFGRIPTTQYFLQKVNLPGLSMDPIKVGNPFVNYFVPGDHIDYDDLSLTFKIDAQMDNFFEIYEWITELGYPKSYAQYAEVKAKGLTSECTLIIQDSLYSWKRKMTFTDVFPIRLRTASEFDTTETSVEYFTATADFKYTNSRVEKINVATVI